MSLWGRVYLKQLPEGRSWRLEVSEKDFEGHSCWGRVRECEFRIEFTRGLEKDAVF